MVRYFKNPHFCNFLFHFNFLKLRSYWNIIENGNLKMDVSIEILLLYSQDIESFIR